VNNLFNSTPDAPLAEQMRPKQLSDLVGQQHLLGPNKPLQLAFAAQKMHSMILWGPPGVGKTTLARLMANSCNSHFIQISAVLSGMQDIREAVQAAKVQQSQGKPTLLFVDEVHRFNKNQQDAFLPFVESGLVTFVGATTENPSFEVNSALLSRVQVYVLHPLTFEDLQKLLTMAQAVLSTLTLDSQASDLLINLADGDARKLLNMVEQVWRAAQSQEIQKIDAEFVAHIASTSMPRFDKNGEQFYDSISALHKAVRGSHPDAALYWLHKMLHSGTDPLYIARRLIRMAWEDIGLADPRAAHIALSALETYERLGSPEGELALSQATIYMAVAAKSNAGYHAHNQARDFIKKDRTRAVPIHLRNAPTKLMNELGYGKHYRYAHDEPHAYAAGENYLPDDMPSITWYTPTSYGLEEKIAEKMRYLRKLDQSYRKDKTK
jgi:putative ATPase